MELVLFGFHIFLCCVLLFCGRFFFPTFIMQLSVSLTAFFLCFPHHLLFSLFSACAKCLPSVCLSVFAGLPFFFYLLEFYYYFFLQSFFAINALLSADHFSFCLHPIVRK